MTTRNLHHLLQPASVALIGASERDGSLGKLIARNLQSGGYQGKLWAVNPKYRTVGALACYATVAELPEPPDLAVIVTPARTAPQLIKQLAKRGTRAAIVISAGFGETGRATDAKLQQAMLHAAQPVNFRILGPNCLGLLVPGIGLNASFAHLQPRPGRIAMLAQSGAMLTAIIDWADERGIGFSHLVSLGGMADVDFGDMLNYLAEQADVDAILLYVEAITHARKFMSAARAAARLKPVFVLKGGRFSAGARAAASHTGALAGHDDVYDAAFKRAGLLRVFTLPELFGMAETLAQTHPPRGDRLAIVTNGGGLGVLAADALAEEGGRLAELAPTTLKQLDKKMPRAWSHGNPLDIIGDATPERYTEALAVIGADPQIDAVLVLHCPVATASSLAVAEAVVAARRAFRVPLLVSWVGGRSMMRSRRLFARSGIPCFAEPAEAIHAFMQLVRYRRNQELLMETPPSPSEVLQCNTEAAAAVIARALNEHRAWLDAGEVKTVLGAYGIPTVATATVADPDQAAQTAARIEGPVALKIASPDISHKSEVGGVILDLHGPAQVRAAALGMQADLQRRLPSARLSGFTVQPMVRWPQAFELIIGMASDELFGPVVLFGHGGTAVEVIGDKTLALPPLNLALARAMIERTRVGRLLGGYRDQPAADREAIALTLLKVAQIAADQPHIAELDINPLLASATGVIALDARIRVSADVVAGPDRLAIKPYPKHLEEPITLADGRRLCLRPIRAEDEPALVRGFERLDPEEIRLRFHHPMKTLDHRLAARLTQIDYDREMALILVEPQTGDIVAVARVNADPDRSRAEYAIIVSKPYTGLGLGFLLMERIITYARNEGIGEIFGNVLQDNEAMLALNRKLGFHLDHEPGELGVVRVSLKLQKPS